MTTHTTVPGTMAQALAPVAAQIETKPAPINVDFIFDFWELLTTVPQGRRYVAWSMCNALNNYAVANIQKHMRNEAAETLEVNQSLMQMQSLGLDQASIDRFNEHKAQIEALLTNRDLTLQQGFEVEMDPLEIAEKVIALRTYIAERMHASATHERDLPQSIEQSIAFRLRTAPKVDERRVTEAFVLAGGKIPLDKLRKIQLQNQLSERDRLVQQMGLICDHFHQLTWKSAPSDIEVEGVFDSLPEHIRYRLIGSTVRVLNVALDQEIAALLRFGRRDAVANRLLLDGVLEAYKVYFTSFGNEHADKLLEAEARGVQLPTLELLLADKTIVG